MKSKVAMSNFDPHGEFGLMLPKSVGARVRQNDTNRFKNWRPMPFYQKGNLNMLWAIFADGAAGGSVVITGEAIQFGAPFAGGAIRAGIRWNNDGNIDEQGPGAVNFTQIDAGEWWSNEPDTGIGASYDVRFLSTGKVGTWTISGAADDAWTIISGAPTWNVLVTAKASPSTKTCSGTFEIRTTGSGSALDSASYSCTADN